MSLFSPPGLGATGPQGDPGASPLTGAASPTTGAGVAAAIGTLYTSTVDGKVWSKTAAGDTAWTQLAFVA